MKVTSTNLAKPTTIIWNGKSLTTGIYKKPTERPIYLDREGIRGDEVSDKKVHGGEFKACYIFSEDHYKYWKNLYPSLEWNWGMFGENLTIKGLNESNIRIGDIYKVGEALVQITQPREPCFKLGIKFESTDVIKQFIEHGFPGTYIRILEPGFVKTEDSFTLVKKAEKSLTTAQFYNLLFAKEKNISLVKLAVDNNALPERKRNKLAAYLK